MITLTDIIRCPRCREEIEHYYDHKDDSFLVGEKQCTCFKSTEHYPKLLDLAFLEIDKLMKVNNAIHK